MIPRYHLRDDITPTVVDVYELYPNQKLKLINYHGYVYVGNEYGERYFMSMHCMSDDKEEVQKYVDKLIEIRKDFSLKEFLYD